MAKPAASKKSAKSSSKGPTKKAKKAKKAKKDPNKPKGASSGFMQYSQAMRNTVRDENPDLKVTEISKVLGERWRNMDENQKKPYNKKAAADKERYQREMEIYNAKKADEEEEDEEDEEEEESEEEDSD